MRYLPEDNLSYPVLITLGDGSQGSGFYLNSNNTTLYLVTAKHVLFNNNKLKNEDPDIYTLKSTNINILSYSKDLTITTPNIGALDLNLLGEENIIKSDKYDVVVIKIGTLTDGAISGTKTIQFLSGYSEVQKAPNGNAIVMVSNSYFKKYEDVLISNEVIIFGYPVSLGTNANEINRTQPLLRKGIIAGKNSINETIIIDCPSYQGNSGGLVIEIDSEAFSREVKAIGIVVGFVPFVEVFESKHFKYVNSSVENSGYSIVIPTDAILALIPNA